MREVTVRLSKDEANFVEVYAQEHQLSVEEVIRRGVMLLHDADKKREARKGEIHEEVQAISGIVPAEVDARAEYADHLTREQP